MQRSLWILGMRFSGADILIASIGQWARDMLPDDPCIDEYLARCNARPALQEAGLKDAPGGASPGQLV